MKKLCFIPIISLMTLVILVGCEEEIVFENGNLADFELTEVLNRYHDWSVPTMTILFDEHAAVRGLEAIIVDDRNRERSISYRPYLGQINVSSATTQQQYANEYTLTVEDISEIINALKDFLLEDLADRPYEFTIRGNRADHQLHHAHTLFLKADRSLTEFEDADFHGQLVRIISGEDVFSILIDEALVERLKTQP